MLYRPRTSADLTQFPHAYKSYHEFCNPTIYLKSKPVLVGRALLIPPDISKSSRLKRDSFYIACLITSEGYGKNVDSEDDILYNTKKALDDLHYSIENADPMPDCRAVRINSGKFGVPWKRTKKVLKDGPLDIVVVRPKQDLTNSEDEDGNDVSDDGSDDSASDSNSEKEHPCATIGVPEEKFSIMNQMKGSGSKITSEGSTEAQISGDTSSGAGNDQPPEGTKRKTRQMSLETVDEPPDLAPKAKQRKKRASEVEKLAF